MPVATDVVLAAAELEDDELLAAPLLDDLPGHLGAGDERLADVHGRAVPRRHEQDLVEHHLGPRVTGELLDHHGLAGLDPVLLATRLDHGVHDLLHENAFGIADFTDLQASVKPRGPTDRAAVQPRSIARDSRTSRRASDPGAFAEAPPSGPDSRAPASPS